MTSDNIRVAALGRPFTLGMLYDASTDQLIPGLTWDNKTLQENTVESSQHYSAYEMSASDSIDSKSTLLHVDASLKASFLSGLIEVGGSANYLNDTKTFKNQSRVTFQYKATTNFKQLSTINLLTKNTKQTDVIERASATHVVTGILYGANAFFVFDSEKLDASSVQDIQGSMQALIKKIPSFSVDGKVDIKLTDEEKALADKFSCKFYGDFLLESNPATFVDAVNIYVKLPKLLGENGENSVPQTVWMRPLKNLVTKPLMLVREIGNASVRNAEDALESITKICMRCNDSLGDRMIDNFSQIKDMLSRFKKLCNEYAADLQQKMAKKLPSIRKRNEDESQFQKHFEDRDQSPFSHEKLTMWLEHKEREINVIRSCVEMMKGTEIVPNQSELDRVVLAPGVEEALCFVFTSVETDDPYLDAMARYLDSIEAELETNTNEKPWYYTDDVLTAMRKKAKAFQDLTKALKNNSQLCFLIAAIPNVKYTGATIYRYREGILITDDFLKLPPVEEITDRRDLLWYSCDLTLDPDTANGYLTLSEENKKATYAALQSYPDLPQRFDYYPQVLCKEGLTGRCYWEVEWSTGSSEDVAVGVSYKGLCRKGKDEWCRLGFNAMSWILGHKLPTSDAVLYAEYNRQETNLLLPASGCTRVGVFLDWPAGSLSFYNVSGDTLTHLKTFYNTFTEPLYPGFYIKDESNYVLLCL